MSFTQSEYQKMEEFVKRSFDFARCNDVASLKIMLDHGLNPNIANHKGDTLLMLAAYNGSLNAVELLLEYHALVDKPNDRGHTPLAGVCFKGYTEIVKILLKHGANPNGYEGNGGLLSPINTAIMFRKKEILKLLLEYNNKKIGFWKKIMCKLYT